MPKIRVLVADDHAVVREGLSRLISDQFDMYVVGEAADGASAAELAAAVAPHVVLLDMRMPGLGGVAAIKRVRERCPAARVLVLSMYEDAGYARAALAAGAHAYLGKREGSAGLLAAIRAVARGGAVTDAVGAASSRSSALNELSSREREVLELVRRGHTGREVASALGISKSSADTYRARVFRKLGVDSRAELLSRLDAHADTELTQPAEPEAP
jgi:DNA-binding NarL/FixJ family response regulator